MKTECGRLGSKLTGGLFPELEVMPCVNSHSHLSQESDRPCQSVAGYLPQYGLDSGGVSSSLLNIPKNAERSEHVDSNHEQP